MKVAIIPKYSEPQGTGMDWSSGSCTTYQYVVCFPNDHKWSKEYVNSMVWTCTECGVFFLSFRPDPEYEKTPYSCDEYHLVQIHDS